MTTSNQNILSQILLEITLVIANQSSYDKIVKKTISAWLRRLNCTSGGLITKGENSNVLDYIIPKYLKNDQALIGLIEEQFDLEGIDVYREYELNDKFYYLFQVNEELVFLFSRTNKLSQEQCFELFPVTQFFGTALKSAKEQDEKKLIEKELRNERRLLRTVLDHLPDAIYLKDLELNKLLTNQADIENIGLSVDDILNKRDIEVFPPKVAEQYEEDDQKVISSGIPIINRQEELINNNGYKRWLLTSKYPFKNEDGELIGLVGIGRDITDQRETEQKVARLSRVASQTTNGVIITGLDGRVEWINEGFTRLTGFSLEEMKGKKPGDILQGPESDPVVKKRMSQAIKTGGSFEEELINYKKDGLPYYIKISCNPLRNEKGDITGFMAIESDITEKVENEKALREAKAIAEKAKDAEKTFLANMSHEIRTPLNGIIGMTNLLKDTSVNKEQEEYITNLDQSSRFLLSLITDILDLAKVEAGKVEPKKELFNLRILLQNLEHTFKLRIGERPVNVHLMVGDTVPNYIVGDELLIQQILNNLMSNAEKFTQEGSISLVVDLKNDNGNHKIYFDVIDSGIGISESDQKNLFQKFNQFGSENDKKKGSGLGLCITKELIEVMDGSIQVESEINLGSKFSVMLPVEISDATQEESIQRFKPIRDGEKFEIDRILIAEDNMMNQKYITRLMQKLNLNYDLANNGLIAVEMCQKQKYSVIFMDLQMPEMDGYGATLEIRNSDSINKDTPIIALTASALTEQRERAFEVGMNDFLTKPFTPAQLKSKLKLV